MKPYRLQTDGTTKSPAGIQPVSVGPLRQVSLDGRKPAAAVLVSVPRPGALSGGRAPRPAPGPGKAPVEGACPRWPPRQGMALADTGGATWLAGAEECPHCAGW